MLELFRAAFRLPRGASAFADRVDWLHFFVISVTVVGVFVLSTIALYFVVRYRQQPTDESTPALHASGAREGMIITGTLSLFVLWWVIGYRQYLTLYTPPPGASSVYVVAKQWMWKFSYPSGNVSNNVLSVEVGRPVELIMTSRDVIHSFFVPALRAKQDVLPGRYVTLSFTPKLVGTFPIYCAEYCGINHSRMLGEVHVLGSEQYQRYLADAAASRSLAQIGRDAALKRGCFSCHTVDGQRHIGPSWSRLFGSSVALTDGQHITADAAYLTESMMDPAARVVAGYSPVMPTYLGTLDAAETAAIVEYIRSLQDGPITPSVKLPAVQVPLAASARPSEAP
ncbi:MAG TPA: cytochrome c oxidase subunit II [Polyangiaceae bacterium]|jgi:cytochrome c oxidase subunit 2|nr:cytochrome c oxidase subunit II [Polyangiaceae bacterium]